MRYVEVKLDDTFKSDGIWRLAPLGCPANESNPQPARACFVGSFNEDGERVIGIPCCWADQSKGRKHEDGKVLQPCKFGATGEFGNVTVRHA